jgi:peptide/nickel transport system substrate-binding protein
VVRSFLMVVLATVLSVGFAGPRDNSVIVGAAQEPTVIGDLLQVLGSQAIAAEHNLWLFEGLYSIDLDANLQPALATEVATVENGRLSISVADDGTQTVAMRLTLRDDIFWSDGTPITTKDLEFVNDVVTTPGVSLAGISYYQRFSYETIDGLNFVVTLSPAQSSDLAGSPMPVLPAHVLQDAWTEAKAAAADVDPSRKTEIFRGVFTDFGSSGAVNAGATVFSGAFQATRWVPGSSMVFQRNPFYFDHPADQSAYARTVEYRYVTDTNSLLFQIVTGAVDTVSSVSISFDQALSPQITSRAVDRYDIFFVPGAVWEHLEINQFTNVQQVADLMLDDVRTRKALVHAIDRQGMTDALFEGLQPVAHSNVSPGDPTYNPDVPQYAYDPEQAKTYLEELGWVAGSDGILQRTVDGRTVRFELEFVTTAGNAVRERQQQFIAEDLRQIGIDVRINNAPSNVVFANEFINRAYDGAWTGMFMFAWVSSQASSLNAATYVCRFAPTPDNGFAGQNAGGACSERYDALRDQAVAELDLTKSLPIYQEMQVVYAEDLLAIPLIFRSTPYVTSLDLVNYVTSTFGNGNGYPPTRPAWVGWAQNGAVKMFDQSDYATQYGF